MLVSIDEKDLAPRQFCGSGGHASSDMPFDLVTLKKERAKNKKEGRRRERSVQVSLAMYKGVRRRSPCLERKAIRAGPARRRYLHKKKKKKKKKEGTKGSSPIDVWGRSRDYKEW